MISVFDIFKIGIGPSSSHTVGPMKAGKQFTDDLIAHNLLKDVTRVVVDVYGSLSLTGKGHHTDIAIIMGLAGNLPDTVDIDSIPGFIQDVNTHGRLMLANGQHEVEFPVDQCMNFHADNLSLHENGMRITALAGDKVVYSQTYYSIGGGFIVDEEHFGQQNSAPVEVPYPYSSAAGIGPEELDLIIDLCNGREIPTDRRLSLLRAIHHIRDTQIERSILESINGSDSRISKFLDEVEQMGGAAPDSD